MSNRFWIDRKWPIDFSDYRFLGRAVDDVGRATFPDDWNGDEPASVYEGAFKRTPPFTRDDRWKNWQLISQVIPQEILGPIRSKTKLGDPPGIPSDIWELAETELKKRNASYERYIDVRGKLIEWFRSGTVRTAVRKHEGGEIRLIKHWDWNSEDLHYRFECGKMDMNNPFAPVEDYRSPHLDWIFVDNSDLAAKLLQSYPEHHLPAGLSHSTILRFAIGFSETHVEDIAKKSMKELKNIIRTSWRKAYENIELPSQTELAIAVVVRSLDQQGGKSSATYKANRSRVHSKSAVT